MFDGVSRNRIAFLYMLGVVLIWSFMPLWIQVSGGGTSPFLFSLAFVLAEAAGVLVFLVAAYRKLLVDRTTLSILRRHINSRMFIALVVTEFDILLLVWSLKYIDIAVATILYETAPILMIPTGLLIFRQDKRFKDTTLAIVIPVAFAFSGLVLVILSQVSNPGHVVQSVNTWQQAFGLVLVILGAASWGIKIPLHVKLGAHFRADAEGTIQAKADDIELFSVLLISTISGMIVLPIFVSGVVIEEGWDLRQIAAGLVAGLLIGSSVKILRRKSNLMTSNLAINALGYATPVIALAWLFLFSRVGDIRIDYLVIGAAAVVVGNLLINFQAEIRFGFRSLILGLWTCGTLVYFRDGLAEHLAIQDWLWPPGEYFTAVSLAATVFTLILSFRVARLVARTNDETNRAFALFSRLDLLAGREIVGDEVRGLILRIDAPESPQDLINAYRSARQHVRRAYAASSNDADRRELAEASAELDVLAHSRQEGQDFGEYVALVIFAVTTVALILFALDEQATGWNGFLTEMFTMLFCAVIIFLVVNVWDLQRERGAPVLQREADDSGYGVVFRDAVARRFEQVVSIVVVLAMTAAYGWLLWEKWLG